MNFMKKIEKLLDDEKHMLLHGDFQNLSRIGESKSKVLDFVRAHRQSITAEQAQFIARKSRENEALLASALRGMQAAILHIRGAADESFQSYSKDGRRKPLSRSGNIQHTL